LARYTGSVEEGGHGTDLNGHAVGCAVGAGIVLCTSANGDLGESEAGGGRWECGRGCWSLLDGVYGCERLGRHFTCWHYGVGDIA
jgi:hypothetical protein